MSQARFTQDAIIQTLTAAGESLDDYFLMGNMPCVIADDGTPHVLLIEDEDLLIACVNYLRSIGAEDV